MREFVDQRRRLGMAQNIEWLGQALVVPVEPLIEEVLGEMHFAA